MVIFNSIKALDYFVNNKNKLKTQNGSVSQGKRSDRMPFYGDTRSQFRNMAFFQEAMKDRHISQFSEEILEDT